MGSNYKVTEYRQDLQLKVNGINERMIKIETTLEAGMPHLIKTLDGIEAHLKELNGRTGRLENWRAYLLGGMAVITVCIPIAIKVLWL